MSNSDVLCNEEWETNWVAVGVAAGIVIGITLSIFLWRRHKGGKDASNR